MISSLDLIKDRTYYISFFQIIINFPNDIDTEKISEHISERENEKHFKIKGEILSGQDWNESLSIVKNLQQIPRVILYNLMKNKLQMEIEIRLN